MNKLTTAIFTTGSIILVAGFLVSESDSIPLVHSLVAPLHYDAMEGLRKLRAGLPVMKGSAGFRGLETVARQLIEEDARGSIFQQREMIVIRMDSGIVIDESGPKPRVECLFSFGPPANMPLADVSDGVDDLKRHRYFAWAAPLFCFGLILDIVGFWIEHQKKK